jgi:hypothetical protein
MSPRSVQCGVGTLKALFSWLYRTGAGDQQLGGLLQLPPLSQGTRQRDARRCPAWQER